MFKFKQCLLYQEGNICYQTSLLLAQIYRVNQCTRKKRVSHVLTTCNLRCLGSNPGRFGERPGWLIAVKQLRLIKILFDWKMNSSSFLEQRGFNVQD